MSPIFVIVTLIVVGVLFWLVKYLHRDGREDQEILSGVVVICGVVWLLFAFGTIIEIRIIR